jgi:hypothetical protein
VWTRRRQPDSLTSLLWWMRANLAKGQGGQRALVFFAHIARAGPIAGSRRFAPPNWWGPRCARRAEVARLGTRARNAGYVARRCWREAALILPRFRGHRDYAANAATRAFNSNSIGLT